MKYFTINSFVETLKESYPSLERVVAIFHRKSLVDTLYRSKQGMPCVIKLFTKEGEQVLKFEDILTLFDEDFYISFKLPITYKDDFVSVDIDTTPVYNEKIDAMYFNRMIRKITAKTAKTAIEEYKKQAPHMVKQAIDGEPFDL